MEPDDGRILSFRQALARWWATNARDFPWRHAGSPYRIAVAEIMLRRTRADQVAPVFERFIGAYPTLSDAARADPEAVRMHLQTLGLAWRAETLIAFLREAHARFGNDLPSDREVLRGLPGIGDYVSAAVACFSGGQAVALIDTNVVRVLGRVFGLDTKGEARRRRDMRDLAARAVDPDRPAEYHYSILDLAARVCLPARPKCEECPLATGARCEFRRRTEHLDRLPRAPETEEE